jgi:hypothetical protein
MDAPTDPIKIHRWPASGKMFGTAEILWYNWTIWT